MKHRLALTIILAALSVSPALSQTSEIAILSEIISASSGGNNQSVNTVSQGISASSGDNKPANNASQDNIGGVLDFFSSSAVSTVVFSAENVLDNIADSKASDSFESLAALVSKQSSGSSLSVLDVITGSYNNMGFYEAGVLDNISSSNYFNDASSITPMTSSSLLGSGLGQVTSGFGFRPKFNRMHKGIDISMAVGDTVKVLMPGVVERVAYESKGYGNYIIVRHNEGYETRYAHLSAPLVAAGQQVMAGEAIALSGNTGNSTGPHLHFEVRYNGTALDPLTVFNFNGNQPNANYGTPLTAGTDSPMATGFNGSKKSLKGKSNYIVREGDTLRKIADRAGISVLRLCQLNFVTEKDTLTPGLMLKLK